MPNDIRWLIENEVIFAKHFGNITNEEVEEINRKELALLDQAPHPIFFIVDLSQLRQLSQSTAQLRNNLSVLGHKQMGCAILVGQTNLVNKLVASVITQVFQIQLHHADTEWEAWQVILEQTQSDEKRHQIIKTYVDDHFS